MLGCSMLGNPILGCSMLGNPMPECCVLMIRCCVEEFNCAFLSGQAPFGTAGAFGPNGQLVKAGRPGGRTPRGLVVVAAAVVVLLLLPEGTKRTGSGEGGPEGGAEGGEEGEEEGGGGAEDGVFNPRSAGRSTLFRGEEEVAAAAGAREGAEAEAEAEAREEVSAVVRPARARFTSRS